MKVIAQDIKNNDFKKVYLIYGEEEYLKRQYRDKLKTALVGDDTMNYAYFKEAECDVKEIIDTCDTMPFFSDRKTVIVENSGFFKKSNEELANYIKNLPDYIVLIFIENEIDKRNKLYKAVSNVGYVTEMTYQSVAVLRTWIATVLKAKDIIITANACDDIISKTGSSMNLIKMELDKLESYCLEKKEVTTKDVEEIVSTQTESHIFDMVEAIANCDQKKALKLYYELLALKESPMRILFLIVRQYNGMLQVKEMNSRHISSKDIAAAIKLPPFVINKYLNQSKKFSMEQIKDALEYFADIEEGVKSGKLNDKMGIELAIVKYSSLV